MINILFSQIDTNKTVEFYDYSGNKLMPFMPLYMLKSKVNFNSRKEYLCTGKYKRLFVILPNTEAV